MLHLICVAIAVHLASAVLMANTNPLGLLQHAKQVWEVRKPEQRSWYERSLFLSDLAAMLGCFILLVRWSDPEMFKGSVSRRWHVACILVRQSSTRASRKLTNLSYLATEQHLWYGLSQSSGCRAATRHA